MEKMLITQALDERDLLVKKINEKIAKAKFADTIKNNEEKVMGERVSREDFAKAAESAYQQISDLITRYERIDAAIVDSNAKTILETSYGKFTVAGAISLRNRLRGVGSYGESADFEGQLQKKMENTLSAKLDTIETKNKILQSTAENMRLSILGKDTKVKDDKPLEVVEAYVRENTTELVDPLDLKAKIAELNDRRMNLLRELDTQIKVSNATTVIEI